MTTTTYDPTTTATSLAKSYTAAAQALITSQTSAATAKSGALSKLQSALSAFETTLSSLSGSPTSGSLAQMSATVSSSSVASASAVTGAAAGTYSLFVEQVATSQQVSFQDLPAAEAGATGKLTLSMANGDSFEVDLGTADSDGNGTLSYTEIARAINSAPDNNKQVTAMVTTVNGKSTMVLSSGVSGLDGKITVSADANVDGPLQTALNTPPKELVAAQNAIVWLGAQNTGLKIEQGSNTVTAIQGVTLNLTQAQASGSAPVTLTVGQDSGATKKNVQSFVDAYNSLRSTLDGLLQNGSETSSGGALASDSSLKSLRDRLASVLRQDVGGVNLRDLGVAIDRSGQLSLDGAKLSAKLAQDPTALDTVFGKASASKNTGLLGSLNTLSDLWTDSNGLIQKRQDSLSTQQKALTDNQTKLDSRYDQLYDRYLKQFSALQTMQEQMSQTTSLLDSLFSSSK
ncbi:MAG: flagellar filament capping protein FliD [Burkholderiaceae bacterium]